MAILLSAEDHAKVTTAVAEAERGTAGEIVTIVADRSDGYTDVALAWAALAGFLIIALLALFPEPPLRAYAALRGAWNADWTAGELIAMAGTLGAAGFILALLAQFSDAVRFALVPGWIKSNRAEARAIDLFKVGAESKTTGRTGVLIYLSLAEHRAHIVADEAIDSRVAEEVWGEAMAAMLAELRQGRRAEGMVAAVERVGVVLAEHFPHRPGDRNELPDRLIEL